MTTLHQESAPDSKYLTQETVKMSCLDSLRAELLSQDDRVYLKLDVQGYELQALRGAEKTLSQIQVIDTELSLASLYEGQPSFGEMTDWLGDAGFDLVSLGTAFRDPKSGRLLQLDGIFARRTS